MNSQVSQWNVSVLQPNFNWKFILYSIVWMKSVWMKSVWKTCSILKMSILFDPHFHRIDMYFKKYIARPFFSTSAPLPLRVPSHLWGRGHHMLSFSFIVVHVFLVWKKSILVTSFPNKTYHISCNKYSFSNRLLLWITPPLFIQELQ